jgi:hypothetical protein
VRPPDARRRDPEAPPPRTRYITADRERRKSPSGAGTAPCPRRRSMGDNRNDFMSLWAETTGRDRIRFVDSGVGEGLSLAIPSAPPGPFVPGRPWMAAQVSRRRRRARQTMDDP